MRLSWVYASLLYHMVALEKTYLNLSFITLEAFALPTPKPSVETFSKTTTLLFCHIFPVRQFIFSFPQLDFGGKRLENTPSNLHGLCFQCVEPSNGGQSKGGEEGKGGA
ncbi:hypothetical protein PoB_005625900 [Plakobranchus ocellatus]|uniref:Uncharacterized protein n=1 Tax=Plakobranchus ocellatus TaxID=259542 RepID=A0AAV4CF32_9GAST|nr:hypothetical protein PoB_005625900 [Plakobranchus ocellatus]